MPSPVSGSSHCDTSTRRYVEGRERRERVNSSHAERGVSFAISSSATPAPHAARESGNKSRNNFFMLLAPKERAGRAISPPLFRAKGEPRQSPRRAAISARSEEPTSELQSLMRNSS